MANARCRRPVAEAIKDRGNATFRTSKTADDLAAAKDYMLATRCGKANRAAWCNLALVFPKLGEAIGACGHVDEDGKAIGASADARTVTLRGSPITYCDMAAMCADQARGSSNRALALRDARDAEPDIVSCKARHRRGLAYEALGKLENALVDCEGCGVVGGAIDKDIARARKALRAKAIRRRPTTTRKTLIFLALRLTLKTSGCAGCSATRRWRRSPR